MAERMRGERAAYRRDGSGVYTPGVSQRRGGATVYDLQDRMGSSVQQTNAGKASTGARTYDAFGMALSSTGTPLGPFGFAGGHGYQEDGDTGLMLLGHRYYDASTGRFLTRDPARDGRNWYGYCEGNPVGATDPKGLTWYYVQSTGQLIWRPEDPLEGPEHAGGGFSGKKGKDRNNPGSEDKPSRGPIPVGGYEIGRPRDKKSSGKPLPYNLPLTPDDDNDMHGRSGFLIHGGSEKGDPSEGCIILPRKVRERIWKSGDHHLEVV